MRVRSIWPTPARPGYAILYATATNLRDSEPSMTRTTRRTSRTPLLESDPSTFAPPDAETDIVNSQEDLCPACSVSLPRRLKDEDSESWVRCDSCKTWYHWRCVGEDGQLETIDKWFVISLSLNSDLHQILAVRFCTPCRAADARRVITMKPPTRKSARNRPVRDYVNLHSGADSSDARRWSQLLESKTLTQDSFQRMRGSELTQEWLHNDPTAMMEPVIIDEPHGLGMAMPPSTLTVAEIAATLGPETPVEVIGMFPLLFGYFSLI
jgi:F-box and leucine-rich repeat protein 10/11